MRVLLVEDDLILGDGIRAGLRMDGFTVDWVRDGVQAALALETETFSLLVLDLGLPRRDGLEVLAEVRRRGLELPVLVLTARDTTADRVRGLDAGADDYMVKPVNLSPREFSALCILAENAGRVVAKSRLQADLYGWEQDVESNAVEVWIHHLRRKLDADLIRTVRGVGYMMVDDGHA